MTIEAMKEIILSSQDLDRDTGITRKVNFYPVPNKAAIFIGVRRSGKSTFLYQIIENLILDDKIPMENILMDLDSDCK